MGDQHFFAELLTVARGDNFGGNAGEIAVTRTIFGVEHERHESGPGIDDLQAELPREVVAE